MAIEYGMTSEEFWKDDPNLFISYRTSFINKKKREKEEMNYECWLQGLYIHKGNDVLNNKLSVSISRMLGGKSHYDKAAYPEKPYELNEKQQNNDKTLKEKQQKNYFTSFNYFATMKQRFVDKIKKGE